MKVAKTAKFFVVKDLSWYTTNSSTKNKKQLHNYSRKMLRTQQQYTFHLSSNQNTKAGNKRIKDNQKSLP
jgi:hypothetical protein